MVVNHYYMNVDGCIGRGRQPDTSGLFVLLMASIYLDICVFMSHLYGYMCIYKRERDRAGGWGGSVLTDRLFWRIQANVFDPPPAEDTNAMTGTTTTATKPLTEELSSAEAPAETLEISAAAPSLSASGERARNIPTVPFLSPQSALNRQETLGT